MASEALIMVDVQNDFCPKGKLAVPKGDEVVEPLNRMIQYAAREQMQIFFTRDWHPWQSKHFKEFGGVWPPHCIQWTYGALFHPCLAPSLIFNRTYVVSKGIMTEGMPEEVDGYSGFHGVIEHCVWGKFTLDELLKRWGVKMLYVGGLATDYCVKQTVLDARKLGYAVVVLEDACRGVDVKKGDSGRAKKEMEAVGARFSTVNIVTRKLK